MLEGVDYAMEVDCASRDRIVTRLHISAQNRLKVLWNPMSMTGGVADMFANVEQDAELAPVVNNANIPNLKAIILVRLWERIHRLWLPQKVSMVSML